MGDGGRRTARGMTLRYGVALTCIGLLVAFTNELHNSANRQNESTALIVNLSGRQRMLSQRSAAFALRMAAEPSSAARQALAEELSRIADALAAAHRLLLTGDPARGVPGALSPELERIYRGGPAAIDAQLRHFLPLLRRLVDAVDAGVQPDPDLVRDVVDTATGSLLSALEAGVLLHQRDGERKVAEIGRLQNISFGLAIAVLAIEALVIFRPMVRRVQRELAANAALIDDLQAVRANLERDVARQTEQIRAARDAAVAAAHAKSRFLAHASHDLLQPLDAIGMFAAVLERTGTPERQAAVLRDLRGALRSMKAILSAIIELSRLESGAISPAPAAFSLTELLEQVAAQMRPLAAAKGLELRLHLRPLAVRTDPVLLERVVRNITANAVRYTRAGGVLIGCRQRGGRTAITVYDTGPGIAAADRARIFEEFTQLDDPARDRSEGIGIGLAIVERLARLLGADIQLRSRPGRGTAFTVLLPVSATLS